MNLFGLQLYFVLSNKGMARLVDYFVVCGLRGHELLADTNTGKHLYIYLCVKFMITCDRSLAPMGL